MDLKFSSVSHSIRHIEDTLAANRRPVAVGIPGYILPTDMDGQLFLKYPKAVKSIESRARRSTRDPEKGSTNRSGEKTFIAWQDLGTRAGDDYLCRWARPDDPLFRDQTGGGSCSRHGTFSDDEQWFTDPRSFSSQPFGDDL